MHSGSTRRTPRRWLLLLIATFAAIAQLGIALAPLAEGREQRMMSHVEASGQRGHFAHDEAKCISCQARLFTGDVERPALPAIVARLVATRPALSVSRHDREDRGRQHSPRAPPTIPV